MLLGPNWSRQNGLFIVVTLVDTAGLVAVDGRRVGPLYEHTFQPALAPSLSFVGVPMQVFAPSFFQAQALSGRAAPATRSPFSAGHLTQLVADTSCPRLFNLVRSTWSSSTGTRTSRAWRNGRWSCS